MSSETMEKHVIRVFYPIDPSWVGDSEMIERIQNITRDWCEKNEHLIEIKGCLNIHKRRRVRMERKKYRKFMDVLWHENSSPDFYEDIFDLRKLFGLELYKEEQSWE